MAASKQKLMFTLEYPIRCSPTILYGFLTTPAGLQEWFADGVDQRESTFYFNWNGSVDTAEMIENFENQYVRYRWDYAPKEEFFEFRIEQSPLTGDTMFKITDFAEKGDLKDQERLWNSQVSDLKHRLGS